MRSKDLLKLFESLKLHCCAQPGLYICRTWHNESRIETRQDNEAAERLSSCQCEIQTLNVIFRKLIADMLLDDM